MNKEDIVINADDAGISLGVNSAIKKMVLQGNLNSVSIMVNGKYVDDIIAFCKTNKVSAGLHLNLTTGLSILGHENLSVITNKAGEFKYGFFSLLIAVLTKGKEVIIEIEKELGAQADFLQKNGIKIEHINGHRHIHLLPKIFQTVYNFTKNNNIPYIRKINESIFNTLKNTGGFRCFINGNFIKWIVLRGLSFINKTKEDVYFFSIVHTCKITNHMIQRIKIPKGFTKIEIMIHPGNSKIDVDDVNLHYETEHLRLHHRDIEAEIKFPKQLF